MKTLLKVSGGLIDPSEVSGRIMCGGYCKARELQTLAHCGSPRCGLASARSSEHPKCHCMSACPPGAVGGGARSVPAVCNWQRSYTALLTLAVKCAFSCCRN